VRLEGLVKFKNSPHRESNPRPSDESNYGRRSASQSALVSGIHLGPITIFKLLSDIAGSLMWGALSDEKTGQ
jgi:hypothetical protein